MNKIKSHTKFRNYLIKNIFLLLNDFLRYTRIKYLVKTENCQNQNGIVKSEPWNRHEWKITNVSHLR